MGPVLRETKRYQKGEQQEERVLADVSEIQMSGVNARELVRDQALTKKNNKVPNPSKREMQSVKRKVLK